MEPFRYPLSMGEVSAVRDRFLDLVFDRLRRVPTAPASSFEAVWIVLPYLLSELMQAYQQQALRRRFQSAGIAVRGFGLETVDAQNQETSIQLERLLWRPGPRQPLLRFLRQARALLRKDAAFDYVPPAKACRVDVPVTFQVPRIVRAYAAKTGLCPRLSRADDWLQRPKRRTDGLDDEARAALAEMFHEAFRAGNEPLENATAAWLSRAAGLGAGWARHQMRVLRSHGGLPRRFWSGTLGSPSNRAFVWVVRERGGTVTGFDHGMGSGLWDTPIQTMLEFDFLDRFVTFAEGMAAGLRNNSHPAWSLGAAMLEVVAINEASVLETRVAPQETRQRVNRILYVPTVYAGEAVHILPGLSDLQMVDWQARLLSALRDRGYEVSIKPHPESRYPVPPELVDMVEGRVVTQRFEQINLKDTILLFDYPQTTALAHAALSACSIVIIDFERLHIRPEACAVIDGRCVRVPAGIDGEGRVRVDWDVLDAACAEAGARRDGRLAALYVGEGR